MNAVCDRTFCYLKCGTLFHPLPFWVSLSGTFVYESKKGFSHQNPSHGMVTVLVSLPCSGRRYLGAHSPTY